MQMICIGAWQHFSDFIIIGRVDINNRLNYERNFNVCDSVFTGEKIIEILFLEINIEEALGEKYSE